MQSRAAVYAISLLIVTAGCRRDAVTLSTSRSTSFGNAQLITQFFKTPESDDERALFHILFVPAVEPPPGGGFGVSGSGGGTVNDLRFDYTYDELHSARKPAIRSRPIHVRNLTTVEADGQSFDLSNGTVFVAHVALDGHLRVIQLPIVAREHDPAPPAVLEAIRLRTPLDARLQALTSR